MTNQRDIMLVPFPFSDQSGKKVRPVVVISNNRFNENSQDVLVSGITTNISKDQHTSIINPQDLEEGQLNNLCCIKVENILKLNKNLIIKKIGKINRNKLKEVTTILNNIIKDEN